MAIFTQKLREKFNAANHREFIMDGPDEAADLAALPGIEGCAIGSIARHIKTKHSFILDSTGAWVPYPFDDGSGGGGGGGGDIDEKDIATNGEVDEMLDGVWGDDEVTPQTDPATSDPEVGDPSVASDQEVSDMINNVFG